MRILLAAQGQSNLAGNGNPDTPTAVVGRGAPTLDPVGPNGALPSMWPSLAEEAGRHGLWVRAMNTAVGGRALTDSWVGRCRTHVPGMNVGDGGYALSDGGVWRADMAAGNAVSTTGPTGTSNTTLDSIDWVYLGAPTARDTDGRIYEPTDSGRFDPNGYMAITLAAGDAVGFDWSAVILVVDIGDNAVGASQAQITEAYVTAARYYMASSRRVLGGMTVNSAGSVIRTYYTDVAKPAWDAACAELESDALFSVGVDCAGRFGFWEDQTSAVVVGMRADNTAHYTTAAYVALGRAWGARIAELDWRQSS